MGFEAMFHLHSWGVALLQKQTRGLWFWWWPPLLFPSIRHFESFI